MLRPLDDHAPFRWIEEAIAPFRPDRRPPGEGVTVAACVPRGYDGYVKIFHAMWRDPSVSDPSLTWAEADPGPPDPDDPIQQILWSTTLVREVSHGGFAGPRVRWRDVAERHGLVFHPEFTDDSFRRIFPVSWPRHLVGPTPGGLDGEQLGALVRALEPFTSTRCFLRWDGVATEWPAGLDVDEWLRGMLFEGELRDVCGERPDRAVASPTYAWPEDRAWCVCTDWDLTFTLVGASRDACEAVLARPEIEGMEVTPEMRVDYGADRINPDG